MKLLKKDAVSSPSQCNSYFSWRHIFQLTSHLVMLMLGVSLLMSQHNDVHTQHCCFGYALLSGGVVRGVSLYYAELETRPTPRFPQSRYTFYSSWVTVGAMKQQANASRTLDS